MQIDFLVSVFYCLTHVRVDIACTLINELKVSLVTLLFNQALLFIPCWWSPKVPSVIHKQRCYTDIALTGLFPLSSTNL